MSVAEVKLTGRGITGIGATPNALANADALEPVKVKLGAVLRPMATAKKVPRLSAFLAVDRASPPTAVDYAKKAKASLSRMYLNDSRGCCVIAGKYHSIGTWSGNDGNAAEVVPDQVIADAYDLLKAGPGDSGCIISDVLDYWMQTGLVVGNSRNKIDGYAAVELGNQDAIKAAIYLFGAVTIGFAIPQEWLNDSTWDLSDSPIVGGHDVSWVGYDESGIIVSSWGRLYKMTWRAATSSAYVSEVYVALDKFWYNDDKLAPSGVDTEGMKKAMEDFRNGILPNVDPVPPPNPPVPPVPPKPPEPPKPIVFPAYSGTATGQVPGFFGLRTATFAVTMQPASLHAEHAAEKININSLWEQIQKFFPPEKLAAIMQAIVAGKMSGKSISAIAMDVLRIVLTT